jgi:crotonobetainyl-CoA:carnitine CoA-transferase CaiB-like acyl-CoA transferase
MGWYAGGVWTAFGVLAALRWRKVSGRGQMVDVSAAEAIMRWVEDMVTYYQKAGVDRQRVGLLDTSVWPYTFVPTTDGYAMIAGFSDVNFTGLTNIMGKEHLREDPRFKTFLDRGRPQNRKALYAELADWSKDHSAQEILALVQDYVMNKKGPGTVATGKVNQPEQILSDQNWWIRGAIEKVEDPVYGEVIVQGPAVKATETPPRVKWVCRPPGADNGYVYLKYLGLGRSRLEELAAAGVV